LILVISAVFIVVQIPLDKRKRTRGKFISFLDDLKVAHADQVEEEEKRGNSHGEISLSCTTSHATE